MTSTTPKRSAYSGRDSTQITPWPLRSASTCCTTRCCDTGSSTAAAWSSTSSTGRLSIARTSATFCRSAHREARAADADLEVQADPHHRGRRPSSSSTSRTSAVMRSTAPACPVTILPNRMLSCSGRRAVIARRIEEFDRALERLRQLVGEMAPRLDHARLEALVDQSQAVPGGDQLERQRQQLARSSASSSPFSPTSADALEDRLELRQVVLADEAVLREELVARRQAAEQLDHGLGDLVAGAQQQLVQPGLAQHLAHVGVAGEVLHVEHAPDRRAEQQVLGERRVAVVARRDRSARPSRGCRASPAARASGARASSTRLGDVRPAPVRRAAQAELEDGFLEVDHAQQLDDALLDVLRPGSSRRTRSRSSRRRCRACCCRCARASRSWNSRSLARLALVRRGSRTGWCLRP